MQAIDRLEKNQTLEEKIRLFSSKIIVSHLYKKMRFMIDLDFMPNLSGKYSLLFNTIPKPDGTISYGLFHPTTRKLKLLENTPDTNQAAHRRR